MEIAEPQHDNRQPAPKQWLYSPISLSLFDTAGGATEFDDWTTRSVLVLQFTDYHWIFDRHLENQQATPLFFIYIYISWRGSQPVQSFRKYIKNRSISNCPGPTSIQQLPDIQFVWYMTGQYFNRLDDPNTPLLKRLLLFFHNTQWIETDRKAMEDLRFFSKPVSVFVNYLKWVYYKRNRTSCNFKKVVWQPSL